MTAGRRGHYATALVGLVIAAATAVGLIGLAHGLPSLRHHYRLTVIAPTAGSIATQSRVTMAGVAVGRVTHVAAQGAGARIDVTFDTRSVTPLPVDSIVRLRTRTAVGETYLAITRGRSRAMIPGGGVIPASQVDEHVDVDQILSTLRGRTKARARTLLQSSSAALGGRGAQLNALLGSTGRAAVDGSRLTQTLARNRNTVAQLVDQFGELAGQLGDRAHSITAIAHRGAATAHAIATRDRQVVRLVHVLPGVLTQLRSTSGQLAATDTVATPVVQNLAGALHDLQPAIQALPTAATSARSILSELQAAAPGLRATAVQLNAFSDPARTTLPAIRKALCAVNPVLRYVRPYTDDVINVVTGLGSGSNAYDAVGHLVRIAPAISDRTLAGAPPQFLNAAQQLMHSGLLGKIAPFTYDPYPGPHEAAKGATGATVQGPSGVPATGYRFPRLHADC